MKKITILGILLLVISSCGNTQAAKKVELSFWDMSWGPTEYPGEVQVVIDAYEEENPSVGITLETKPWNNWYQTWITAVTSDSLPSLGTTASPFPFLFDEYGVVEYVNDIYSEWAADGTLNDLVKDGDSYYKDSNGNMLALPHNFGYRVWYVRKDILEQYNLPYPKTWNDFYTLGEALQAHNIYVFADSGAWWQGFMNLVINNGSGLFKKDAEGNIVSNILDPKFIAAAQFYHDMLAKGYMMPGTAGKSKEDVQADFAQGKFVVKVDTNWLENSVPSLKGKIDVVRIESPSGENKALGWINPLVIFKSDVSKQAKNFGVYFIRNNKNIFTEGHLNPIPVWQSFLKDPYYQGEVIKKDLDLNFNNGGRFYATLDSGFPKWTQVEGESFLFSLVQDLLRQADVMETLQKANDELNTILNK